MTKKTIMFMLLFISGIIILFIFVVTYSGKSNEADIYSVKTFESGDGWGYKVTMNEQLIIFQPHIPCIEGEIPFPDEKSALAIAELVVENLKKTGDPSITLDNLQEIINIDE